MFWIGIILICAAIAASLDTVLGKIVIGATVVAIGLLIFILYPLGLNLPTAPLKGSPRLARFQVSPKLLPQARSLNLNCGGFLASTFKGSLGFQRGGCCSHPLSPGWPGWAAGQLCC